MLGCIKSKLWLFEWNTYFSVKKNDLFLNVVPFQLHTVPSTVLRFFYPFHMLKFVGVLKIGHRALFQRWLHRWGQISSHRTIPSFLKTRNDHWGLNPGNVADEGAFRSSFALDLAIATTHMCTLPLSWWKCKFFLAKCCWFFIRSSLAQSNKWV